MEIVFIIVGIIVGIVAIKICFSFDINSWLQNRLQHKKDSLKVLCPHTDITLKDNNETKVVQSLFQSPYGTTEWICSRCGMRTHDSDIPQKLVEHYFKNPNDYLKRMKKFNKLVKKIYKT